MRLIEACRRSRVLKKARFGCLSDVYAINVTRGCSFSCTYCYARGYPDAPSPGDVILYADLPEKLERELDRMLKRAVPSLYVVLNTASDCFQQHPAILETTYRVMEILIERRIGFSFLTKGAISDRFFRLFARDPSIVFAQVGLVSTDERYRRMFEPEAAEFSERLANIERLKEVGIDPEVRVDPIIPFCTDAEEGIKRLLDELCRRKVERLILSYLHLRPAILMQLRRELPPLQFKVIEGCFKTQPWSVVGSSTRSKLISVALRKRGYERFSRLAQAFGIEARICSCKNPDISASRCSSRLIRDHTHKGSAAPGEQLSLFPC